MMRSWKKTGLLLFLVLALVFFYLMVERYERRSKALKEDESRLVSWPVDEITRFSFLWGRGDVFRLEQGENRTWQIVKPSPLPAHRTKIEEFLSGLREIRLLNPLPIHAQEDPYELKEVNHWIRLYHRDGQELTIKWGGAHPITGERYLQIQGNPAAFLVNAAAFDELKQGVAAFTEHTLMRMDPWQVTRLEQQRADGIAWAAEKNGGKWVLASHRVRADGTQVEAVLALLGGLEWRHEQPTLRDDMADPVPKAEDYVYRVFLQDEQKHDKPRELVLYMHPLAGKKETWEMVRSGDPFQYRVVLDVGKLALVKSDYANVHHKEVFDFFPWQAKEIVWEKEGHRHHWKKHDGQWVAETAARQVPLPEMPQWLELWARLAIRHFIPMTPAQWPHERGRYGFPKQALVSGYLSWESQTAGELISQPFYYSRAAGKHYLLVFDSKEQSVDAPPDYFEIFEISDDFLNLLSKVEAQAKL